LSQAYSEDQNENKDHVEMYLSPNRGVNTISSKCPHSVKGRLNLNKSMNEAVWLRRNSEECSAVFYRTVIGFTNALLPEIKGFKGISNASPAREGKVNGYPANYTNRLVFVETSNYRQHWSQVRGTGKAEHFHENMG